MLGHQVGRTQDHGQNVVEVVGNASGQGADALQLLGLDQLLLQALALGDVLHGAEDAGGLRALAFLEFRGEGDPAGLPVRGADDLAIEFQAAPAPEESRELVHGLAPEGGRHQGGAMLEGVRKTRLDAQDLVQDRRALPPALRQIQKEMAQVGHLLGFPQEPFAVAQGLFRGVARHHVGQGADGAHHLALGVEKGRPAHQERDPRPVLGDEVDFVLAVDVFPALTVGRADELVVGLVQQYLVADAPEDLLGLVAQELGEPAVDEKDPVLVVHHHHDLIQVLEEVFVLGLAFPQPGLDLNLVGHVPEDADGLQFSARSGPGCGGDLQRPAGSVRGPDAKFVAAGRAVLAERGLAPHLVGLVQREESQERAPAQGSGRHPEDLFGDGVHDQEALLGIHHGQAFALERQQVPVSGFGSFQGFHLLVAAREVGEGHQGLGWAAPAGTGQGRGRHLEPAQRAGPRLPQAQHQVVHGLARSQGGRGGLGLEGARCAIPAQEPPAQLRPGRVIHLGQGQAQDALGRGVGPEHGASGVLEEQAVPGLGPEPRVRLSRPRRALRVRVVLGISGALAGHGSGLTLLGCCR